ncbi:MAG: phosphoadenosine phosphosulfate reductase family protein, partial [Peptostreptococcaceae bacterium]
MTRQELIMLQALPLEVKILKTKQRIREFISYFGVDGVYISFSGGKDSTVLLDIVRQEYPQVEAVFSNTGLEYPEIVQFARSFENVTMVRPKKTFKQVIQEHGYPIISKKTSRMLRDLQNAHDGNAKSRKLYLSRFRLDADGNETDKPNG